jgi:hypothetical protein
LYGRHRGHRYDQAFGDGFRRKGRRHTRKEHHFSAEAALPERFRFTDLSHRDCLYL